MNARPASRELQFCFAVAAALLLASSVMAGEVAGTSQLRRLPSIDGHPNTTAPSAESREVVESPPPVMSQPVNNPAVANSSADAQSWLHRYDERIHGTARRQTLSEDNTFSRRTITTPWWDTSIRNPLDPRHGTLTLNIAALSENALRYSSYVQVVNAVPQIRQTELVVRESDFDWRSFLSSTYNNINEPIGSTLTTGTNDTRFKDTTWDVNAGLRRDTPHGGEVEVYQRIGRQSNNSRFLQPNPQVTTRLELQFTQPLLKGGGRAYNERHIVLARIQLNQAGDAAAQQLESHLVSVTEAYWELYRARAEFLQRQKLLDSAERILGTLEQRRGVDAIERQIYRAKASVANRKSEMVRAGTTIQNWESQLRLLVNDPALVGAVGYEFTPGDSPLDWRIPLSMSESLHTALMNRPDISHAIREVRGAAVELGAAEQDILPQLDLVASAYVAGLKQRTQFGAALGSQFTEGRPSFTYGFQFEIPLGNRAAHAQAERRRLELARAMSRFRLTVEEGLTKVERAVREVETSYREMVAKHDAMQAAASEAAYLEDRWRVLPAVGDSAALLLENLLDAQERVSNEEASVVRAQVNYCMALIRLKSEMGTLLCVCKD